MAGEPTHDEIVALIGARAYGRVMSNLTRPIYVEAMVALLLGEGWKYLGDWGGWDLERQDGRRVEVKQTAARQPWTQDEEAAPRFDIAPREGYWLGTQWVACRGRHADVFVFAHHPVFDAEVCDHRDPAQWRFYVLPTARLPEGQRTIGLEPLKALDAKEVPHQQLADEVEHHCRL
jgi:hypothetical protein